MNETDAEQAHALAEATAVSSAVAAQAAALTAVRAAATAATVAGVGSGDPDVAVAEQVAEMREKTATLRAINRQIESNIDRVRRNLFAPPPEKRGAVAKAMDRRREGEGR